MSDKTPASVLKLAADLASIQREQNERREDSRQIDHDLLIKIDTKLDVVLHSQEKHENDDKQEFALHDTRIVKLETTSSEQRGALKMAVAAGSVVGTIGGAIAGIAASFWKH